MDFDQLRQLDAIDREGTISAAAERLHLSQPALSRSMQRLEAELGQPLFDRTGRRSTLNAAGRTALEHARRILREEQLMRDALAVRPSASKSLVVGTVAPAPLWRLTSLLAERLPQAVLTSQTLSQQTLERAVLNDTVDLGLSLRPTMLPTIRSALFMTESLSVALPAAHPLAGRQNLSAAELDGETFLLFNQIGFWQDFCDKCFPRSRFVVQDDRVLFEQYAKTSDLPYFVTDAAGEGDVTPPAGRVVVPLRDTSAHATFYLLVSDAAPAEAQQAFDLATAL